MFNFTHQWRTKYVYAPIGSVWRKWDLHLHTASSYDYDNKSITNKEIVEVLKNAGISAIAITDHHLIDVERIKQIQKMAGEDITVFPGIELRSELGGKELVHFIGVFPEDSDIADIWTKLQGPLKITPKDVEEKGHDKVYVDFKDTAELIHQLGGIVSVHAGKKSNTIENLSNAQDIKRAIKADLAKESIDIFEIGKVDDIKGYSEIVFPHIGKEFPIIICTDNHNAKEYETKAPCWIKADTTFEGLKQVLNEPARIFIGDVPEKIEMVNRNKTKYVSSLEIDKIVDSQLDDIWLEGENPTFNDGLIAIIGNKGSGKSALSDTVGLLGGTTNFRFFSFLNDSKFRQGKTSLASNFSAKLKWKSGFSTESNLNSDPEKESLESVRYIPQAFLEKICNEITGTTKSQFDKELEDVIFSHVDTPNRQGYNSLQGLIEHRTEETKNTIGIIKDELGKINKSIDALEKQNTPEYRQHIQKLLKLKQDEFALHEKNKPVEVKKPDTDEQKQTEIANITKEIEANEETLKALLKSIEETQVNQKNFVKQETAVKRLVTRLENFRREFNTLKNDCSSDLELLGFEFDDLVKLEISDTEIDDKKSEIQEKLNSIEKLLSEEDEQGLLHQKNSLEDKTKELKKKLDEPNRQYQKYLEDLKKWEDNGNKIKGDPETEKSIQYYEFIIKDLDTLPKALGEAYESRSKKTIEIFSEISNLVDTYRELYNPVQEFIKNHPLAKDKFNLNFDVSIIESNFEQLFFEFVSQGKAGTFCGVEEGLGKLRSIIKSYDFNKSEELSGFINDIMTSLKKDRRTENGDELDIRLQLRKGKDARGFYDFVYSLGYLEPHYVLKLGDKELSKLSPGEKGTLLLIFYLLVDKSDIPLVIDQPEENLDNQTVYDLLVPCFREAKQRRQIFIVTHNPNLAVVCDAEQIIYAEHDKANRNKITYESGSIENPKIRKRIIDVLEGTPPAFNNREQKYGEQV